MVTKIIHSTLPPLTIAYLRFVLGGLFLLPVVVMNYKKVDWTRVHVKDWLSLVLLSFIGITGTFTLFHIALYYIDASSAATLIAMVPLFVAPLSFFILKERMSLLKISAVIVGGVGILMIYLSEERGFESLLAVLIMCVAVSCFSIYAVLMKPLNKKMDPRVTTSLSLLLGGIMMIPILLVDGAPLWRPLPISSLLFLLFLSFIAVGLAYLLYFIGLERIDVSTGNSLMYLKPIIATFLAWAVISEEPPLLRIIGILIISISVFLVIKERKWSRVTQEKIE